VDKTIVNKLRHEIEENSILLQNNSMERTYITKHATPLKLCFTMRNGACGAIEKLRVGVVSVIKQSITYVSK
jgi:hypothetical protein